MKVYVILVNDYGPGSSVEGVYADRARAEQVAHENNARNPNWASPDYEVEEFELDESKIATPSEGVK